jgi:hypothetical protein
MTGTPNTRVAEILVAVGYLIGAAGVCVGFATREPAGALAWVALISVGGLGLVSFVRHSIFYRSDAARFRSGSERRNNFQVEVGLANLALALVAIAAYVGRWNVAALAAVTMVYGVYLFQTAVLDAVVLAELVDQGTKSRARLAVVATFVIALALVYFSVRVLAKVPSASR